LKIGQAEEQNAKSPDAVPLRPREFNTTSTAPPKCPLDGIKFIQLKPKKNLPTVTTDKMNEGFDNFEQIKQ
jgi:hypothetical protein